MSRSGIAFRQSKFFLRDETLTGRTWLPARARTRTPHPRVSDHDGTGPGLARGGRICDWSSLDSALPGLP